MDRNFAAALKLVLRYEGGYVNHPADPGGPTNKGITLATYRRFVDGNGSIEDLKAITPQQVAKVYRHQYWDAVKGDDLPDGVDFATFDFAVNSGPKRAAQYLQRVVGAQDDGDIGPATLSAVRSKVSATVINDLCDKRLGFMQRLKTWPTFKRGWTDRVVSVRIEANKMAAQAALGKAPPAATPEPAQRVPPPPPISVAPKGEDAPASLPAAKVGIGGALAAVGVALALLWHQVTATVCSIPFITNICGG